MAVDARRVSSRVRLQRRFPPRAPLQRQPFRILAAGIERAREVVTRDDLRARPWPDGTVVDLEHSVNTAVRKLRRALRDSPEHPLFMETVAGRGFTLCIPVERSVIPPNSRRAALAAAPEIAQGRFAKLFALNCARSRRPAAPSSSSIRPERSQPRFPAPSVSSRSPKVRSRTRSGAMRAAPRSKPCAACWTHPRSVRQHAWCPSRGHPSRAGGASGVNWR